MRSRIASNDTWRRTGWAALFSGGVGILAWWRRALTPSGALGALLTGTSITGAGGWDWGAALVYFFVSSSALSRLATRRKLAAAADKFDKSSRRDLGQALANGGVASALALFRAAPYSATSAGALAGAFAGALGAANADTWATEIGTLSPYPPRLITTGQQVAPGTSGGITPLGLAASAAGACTLGIVFALCEPHPTPHPTRQRAITVWRASRFRAAALGGLAGSLADSLLGATVQGMYCCPRCRVETERRVHRCGAATVHVRGIRWVNNDVVNAVCTLIGALAGLLASANYTTLKDHA